MKKSMNSIMLFNIVLFGFFLLFNFFQPLIVDDLCRGGIAALYHHTVFDHLISDYKVWTGRMCAQFLAYVIFNEPYATIQITIFNILNSLLLVYFLNLLFWMVIDNDKNKKTFSNFVGFVLIILIILVSTGFLKNAIWKTVAIQYFWGIVFFSYLVYRSVYRSNMETRLNQLFYFISGLFLGLYNEIIFSQIFVLYSMGFIYAYFLDNKNYSLYTRVSSLLFMIGTVIGGIVLLVAPGNYAREKIADAGLHFTLIEKLKDLCHSLLNGKALTFLIIVYFIIYLVRILYPDQKTMEFKKNIFFIILMLGLLMVYLPVGNMALPDRALMLVSVVISVLLLRSVYCSQFFVSLYLKKNITTGFLVTNIVLLSLLLKVYFELHVFNQSRMRMLDALRLRNITVAELPGYNKSGFIESLVVFNDITIDKTAWQNQCFSSYYQFKESVLD